MDKKNTQLLEKAVAATKSDGVIYTTEKQRAKLLDLGLIEFNPDDTDAKGKCATRATSKGVTTLAMMQDGAEAPEPEQPKEVKTVSDETTGFELEKGIEVPKVKRGGKRKSKYPFDVMEVDQSFHVAVSEKVPNPKKTLSGSTAVANKKCKNEDGTYSKRFVCREVDETDPKGPGARVFRIE